MLREYATVSSPAESEHSKETGGASQALGRQEEACIWSREARLLHGVQRVKAGCLAQWLTARSALGTACKSSSCFRGTEQVGRDNDGVDIFLTAHACMHTAQGTGRNNVKLVF